MLRPQLQLDRTIETVLRRTYKDVRVMEIEQAYKGDNLVRDSTHLEIDYGNHEHRGCLFGVGYSCGSV